MWKKLNSGSTMLQAKLAIPSPADDGNPVKSFVQLEYYNGVQLLQTVHKSLSGLSKVIRGTALLDEKVSRLADALLRQETPAKWLKMWDGPEDPVEYIQTVVGKANEVQKWLGRVDSGSLLTGDLDLADLFHPDTFLGALRQLTAREFGMPMDELKLANSWNRSGLTGAKISISVVGMMLEGAAFDGNRLVASEHDSPTHSMAPGCVLAWVPDNLPDHYSREEAIRLPLYLNSERDKIVASLDLPCGSSGSQDKWLQSGTVLFLSSVI